MRIPSFSFLKRINLKNKDNEKELEQISQTDFKTQQVGKKSIPQGTEKASSSKVVDDEWVIVNPEEGLNSTDLKVEQLAIDAEIKKTPNDDSDNDIEMRPTEVVDEWENIESPSEIKTKELKTKINNLNTEIPKLEEQISTLKKEIHELEKDEKNITKNKAEKKQDLAKVEEEIKTSSINWDEDLPETQDEKAYKQIKTQLESIESNIAKINNFIKEKEKTIEALTTKIQEKTDQKVQLIRELASLDTKQASPGFDLPD